MQDHHRRTIRLPEYDYAQSGFYFLTICTHNRVCLFGDIAEGTMRLNDAGRMVEQCWGTIPAHFPHVALDECMVMPNHVHGILRVVDRWATGRGTACRAPTGGTTTPVEQFGVPVSGSIPTVIRSFKSAVTKGINEISQSSGRCDVWQRNYWEHVIRDETELQRIREYICDNPLHWATDELYLP